MLSGGPDGELSAALRYLNQRFTMPTNNTKAIVTDIGTEELAHLEIIATLCYKLTKDADKEQLFAGGFDPAFVEHGKALYYQDATGNPWTASYIQAKDDPITDLTEDMAAEQKARTTYDNILRLIKDRELLIPCVFSDNGKLFIINASEKPWSRYKRIMPARKFSKKH